MSYIYIYSINIQQYPYIATADLPTIPLEIIQLDIANLSSILVK